ncbi:MAG: hypothetical protein EBQ71_14845 [Betaproteobacteria bacterium]|nr:hypothetical protein [Betaproteobacteria bacterium]
MKTKSKLLPSLASDAAAERFVAEADLSKYDLSGFKPASFEFEPKAAALNLRLPQNLLDASRLRPRPREYLTHAMSGYCWKMMSPTDKFVCRRCPPLGAGCMKNWLAQTNAINRGF